MGAVLVRQRDEYFRLVAVGMTKKGACAQVGVSRRTSWNWEHVADESADPPGDRFLSLLDRKLIADGVLAGFGVRAIARQLGRSPSTISRELRRPYSKPSARPLAVSALAPRRQYRPLAAQRHAYLLRRRAKLPKLDRHERLRSYVVESLTGAQRWSPQQISCRLRTDFPDDAGMRISHESIYRYLFVHARGELKQQVKLALRQGRDSRRRKVTGRAEPDQPRSHGISIRERPAEAEDRVVPGHWEGDLIIGARGLSQVGTLVERSTRFVLLLHLPRDRTAATVAEAMSRTLMTLPPQLWRSITWDQGAEMAHHARISAAGVPVYFADPHAPWQRGSNENTNGLLRQYLPKGTRLDQHSADDLAAIAAALNGRPRKTLDWATPAEAMATLINTI